MTTMSSIIVSKQNFILNVNVIYLMSITRGLLAQSPEPEASDNVF